MSNQSLIFSHVYFASVIKIFLMEISVATEQTSHLCASTLPPIIWNHNNTFVTIDRLPFSTLYPHAPARVTVISSFIPCASKKGERGMTLEKKDWEIDQKERSPYRNHLCLSLIGDTLHSLLFESYGDGICFCFEKF